MDFILGPLKYLLNAFLSMPLTHSVIMAVLLQTVLSVSLAAHILLNKTDVKAAIGWIGLVFLSPVMGGLIYIIFGINRVQRKAVHLKYPQIKDLAAHLTPRQKTELEGKITPAGLRFFRFGMNVHPQVFVPGNKIRPLINGDEAYPQMLRAIKEAQKEVFLASYIFEADAWGMRFIEAMKHAAARGAQVRVLIDSVGSAGHRRKIRKALQDIPGIKFAEFLPKLTPFKLSFLNLRNHRKIITVDRETAFFGGMNISAENVFASNPKHPVQDITFKIDGPLARQIADIFIEDWHFSTGEKIENRFPRKALSTRGAPARAVHDGPDLDTAKIEMLLLGAVNAAEKSIYIQTPYFLPGESMLKAVEMAAWRGVDTNIIIPQRPDIPGMASAMEANFKRLLSKGVKIYYVPPPFDHSKLTVIDGIWGFFGSANWDERSFKLNFESNVECIGKSVCGNLEKYVKNKMKNGVKLDLNDYKKLSVWRRLRNGIFRLATPYY